MKRAAFLLVAVQAAALCAGEPDFNLSAKDGNVGFALAPELRDRILRPSHVRRILSVDKIESLSATYQDRESKELKGYLLLRITLSVEGDFVIEGIWHGELCYARRPTDADWTSAVQFHLPRGVEFGELRVMPPDELETLIRKAPNKPVQTNSVDAPRGSGSAVSISRPPRSV